MILCDTQELKVLLFKERHGVSNSRSKNSLEIRSERSVVVIATEVGLCDVRERSRWVVEDSRPLLDFLEEVLREECGVTRF